LMRASGQESTAIRNGSLIRSAVEDVGEHAVVRIPDPVQRVDGRCAADGSRAMRLCGIRAIAITNSKWSASRPRISNRIGAGCSRIFENGPAAAETSRESSDFIPFSQPRTDNPRRGAKRRSSSREFRIQRDRRPIIIRTERSTTKSWRFYHDSRLSTSFPNAGDLVNRRMRNRRFNSIEIDSTRSSLFR